MKKNIIKSKKRNVKRNKIIIGTIQAHNQALYVKKGANVNERDMFGRTPLFYINRPDIAQLLIKHGADIYIRDEGNRTPLFYVENIEMADFFINKGIKINVKDNDEIGRAHV